jgi:hypothetical protein
MADPSSPHYKQMMAEARENARAPTANAGTLDGLIANAVHKATRELRQRVSALEVATHDLPRGGGGGITEDQLQAFKQALDSRQRKANAYADQLVDDLARRVAKLEATLRRWSKHLNALHARLGDGGPSVPVTLPPEVE